MRRLLFAVLLAGAFVALRLAQGSDTTVAFLAITLQRKSKEN